jgi:hypothetical protein
MLGSIDEPVDSLSPGDLMTFSSALQPAPTRRAASRSLGAILIAVIATTVVGVLTIAGITFVGLAIAFPIALPVAERFHVAVSTADAAIAQQFAQFAWVFAVFALASFTAAAGILIKTITTLSPSERD